MLRQTIKHLPDEQALKMSVRDMQQAMRNGTMSDLDRQKARLFAQLTSLAKQFINLGIAFEEQLSEPMMHEVSAAMYALEWKDLYDQALTEHQNMQALGYWRRLWLALCNKPLVSRIPK